MQRFTKHQVPRGVRADSETVEKLLLIKNVSAIRLTYQVKLLALRAAETNRKLLIFVPRGCKVDGALQALLKEMPRTVEVKWGS